MSREIKFRAWYNAYSEYFNVELIDFVEKKAVLKSIVGNLNFRTRVDFTKFDLEQFSGMKDKYAKDIYEGDIVDYGDELYVVSYDEKEAQFQIAFDNIVYPLGTDWGIAFEVIGNIHENEDLLSEKGKEH